ncbi:MAG: DUF493 domain-containing protein [Deltaproteobacteria bacterium]|nr:MAG: DUF493 domain-containing protein [Deltaproteobacteria bacterium]
MKSKTNKTVDLTGQRLELEYPCTWTYKIIGEDCTLLKEAIQTTCRPQEVQISLSKSSSKGKYHCLDATLTVDSEEMRLRIFEGLKASPAVKIIL